MGIAPDSIGFMWFGTQNGLYRYDGEKFDAYPPPLRKGWPIASNRIRNVVSDADRQIWALTADQRYITYSYERDSFRLANQASVPPSVKVMLGLSANEINRTRQVDGLHFFMEGNQLKATDARREQIQVEYPDPSKSRHRRENFVSSFYVDDHAVWVGTWGGRILKATHSVQPGATKVILSQLYISGNVISPGQEVFKRVVLDKMLFVSDKITLDHHHRDFGIDLLALSQESGEHTFQYRLLGYENKWQPARDHVDFSKVPSGLYKFEARAVSPTGNTSESVSLRITIKPPWYASPSAVGLYHLSMLFGLVSCVAYRNKRSRKRGPGNTRDRKRDADIRQKLSEQRLRLPHMAGRAPGHLPAKVVPPDVASGSPFVRSTIDETGGPAKMTMDPPPKATERIAGGGPASEIDMTLNPTLDDVIAIIRDGVDRYSLMARCRNVTLSFASSRPLLMGQVDAPKLRHIVENLISHAFKYTPNGDAIFVEVELSGSYLIISAKNRRYGVRDTDRSWADLLISERTSADMGAYSETNDLLAQTYVNLLNGTVHYKSEPNQGIRAEIRLPYEAGGAIADHAGEAEISEPSAAGGPGEGVSKSDKRPSVLIVEDDLEIRYYLQTELEEEYRVLTADNGVDGLKTAQEELPQLVLSDVLMPGLDGNAMCKQLKQASKTSHIPVILLTAKRQDQDHVAGLSSGADVYFSKPFNVTVLKAQIRSMIANRTVLQPGQAASNTGPEEKGHSELDKRFINSAVEVIERHMGDTAFNPELLADHLQISPRQLYRKLNAISGNTVSGFIMQVRMEKAADLLKDWQLNVSEVASRVGISEASNFSRAFRKHYGCSPSRYRKDL
ncbi:response regulator [Lewinella sp. IMCC34191]|uniref:hybrid sensor histidine kinase/response regulator transcription factor n=1 Tax=Lewinella sp. IMCC34191 TaxID=2259172 RepID=UPI0018E565DA|nr:response regulator [Lewinella sp. IMCC34191]